MKIQNIIPGFCMLISCMMIPVDIHMGLSYDDVLLVPKKSPVSSRTGVTLKTKLTRNIELNMPIVSANMDTVTESKMAIAMAQLGGIGIIHRFNTIEQQVEEVRRVKRARNAIIEHPFTIQDTQTIAQALDEMHAHEITSLLIVNDNKQLVGIITSRDTRFCTDIQRPVTAIMTPIDRMVLGKSTITIEEAKDVLCMYKLEKLPLIHEEEGTIAGLITYKDIVTKTQFPMAAVDKKDRYLVGAAIGVKDDAIERARALVEAGADVLVIDIAHGDCDAEIAMIKDIKALFPDVDIIAGNVATAQGTKRLIEAGADAVKVGIGPGSICTTRITTGAGYPQLSAIINCAEVAKQYGVPVIADGGICYSGDLTKAIGAGASTVMLGSLLAGTEESPGTAFIKGGRKYKVIRGMASLGAALGRNAKTQGSGAHDTFVPEGVEGTVPYRGKLSEIVYQLLGGLRSGLTYCGCSSLYELIGNGSFVQITAAGVRESHPHDIQEAVR